MTSYSLHAQTTKFKQFSSSIQLKVSSKTVLSNFGSVKIFTDSRRSPFVNKIFERCFF